MKVLTKSDMPASDWNDFVLAISLRLERGEFPGKLFTELVDVSPKFSAETATQIIREANSLLELRNFQRFTEDFERRDPEAYKKWRAKWDK